MHSKKRVPPPATTAQRRARMRRRRTSLTAAACACALACTVRGAHAQLSQLAARVDNCHGSASGARCVRASRLAPSTRLRPHRDRAFNACASAARALTTRVLALCTPASPASCVPSLQLTFDVSWPAPTWAAVAVLPRGASRAAQLHASSELRRRTLDFCARCAPPGFADQGIVDDSGSSWAPTADIVLTVSSAQPGRSGALAAPRCQPLRRSYTLRTRRLCARI